ncbi:MAG: hypothetical protein ACKVII_07220 [Planctomycetales bacterium]|jgi:hypothetical protein
MESIALSAAANSRWLIAAITVCIGSVCVGDELPEPLPVSVTSDQRVDALMRELTTLKGRISQLEQNSYAGDSVVLDDPLEGEVYFDDEVSLDEDEVAPPTHVLARR